MSDVPNLVDQLHVKRAVLMLSLAAEPVFGA
jgi:hypothetical protein